MANKTYGKKRTVPYRRKREFRTNYKKRLDLLKSGKPRLVIRKTNNKIIVQIVEYHPDGDKVLLTSTSKDVEKMGWKGHTGNLPSAYLTGMLAAKKAIVLKLKEAILDLGLQSPVNGGKIYAALKGVVEGGLNVPHSDEVLPSNERISGQHIVAYAEKIKSEPVYAKQFSNYTKKNQKPEELNKHFEEIKTKIQSV